jgi:WD40 repeat protein
VNLELLGVILLTASTPLSTPAHTVVLDTVSFEQVEYSADSSKVEARAADGTVYVHDASTGAVVSTVFVGPVKTDRAPVPTAYSADRVLAVSGDHDGIVRVRHVATGDVIIEYEGHVGTITDVAISPDGTQIASVDDGGMGLFWPMP